MKPLKKKTKKGFFSLTSISSTIDWRDHKFFGSEVRVIYSEGCERENWVIWYFVGSGKWDNIGQERVHRESK